MMFINIAEGASTLLGTEIVCPAGIKSLTDLINWFTCTLVDAVIPLLFALALAGFVFGLIKFFLNPDNEEQKKAGKSFMIWGLVTIFVMVSIWGLVGILSNTFLKDSTSNTGVLPTLKISK